MQGAIRRRLFARLAATSIALGTGSAAAATDLAEIPTDILSEVIEEAEESGGSVEERERVLRLVAADARPVVRGHAAQAAASLWPDRRETALELLRELALDRAQFVQTAAATGLARAIARAAPADRISLVCDWVLSQEPLQRKAVARALLAPTPVFVTDLAIECLACDANATVRAAALAAAAAHFGEAPGLYRELGARFAADPDRSVRKAARAVLNLRA